MSIPSYNHHHMTSMPFMAGGILPTVGAEGQLIEGQQPPCEYNLLNLKKRHRKLYTKMNIGDQDEYEDNEEQNEAVYANMINNGRNKNDQEDEEDEEEDDSDDEDDSDEEEEDDDEDEDEREDEEDDEDLIFEEAQEEMQQWLPVDKTVTMIPMRDRKIVQACTLTKFIGNGNQVVVTRGKWKLDEKHITRSLSAHT